MNHYNNLKYIKYLKELDTLDLLYIKNQLEFEHSNKLEDHTVRLGFIDSEITSRVGIRARRCGKSEGWLKDLLNKCGIEVLEG